MKIAVGIDFSVESDRAAWQAVELARHVGGEVVLVHVVDSVGLSPPGPRANLSLHGALETYRKAVSRSLEWARGELAERRERLTGQGPTVSQVLVEGLPDQGLCRAAEELAADLVVVGTHGRTGLRWFFLGSVAQHVVRLARTDALVARGDAVGRGGYRRILVATDFTPGGQCARSIARSSWPRRAPRSRSCTAGSSRVIATPEVPPIDWGALESTTVAELAGGRGRPGRRRASATAARALRFSIHRLAPIPGRRAPASSRSGSTWPASARRGRTGLARALLGSVAEAVVRRAPCSVLIARTS